MNDIQEFEVQEQVQEALLNEDRRRQFKDLWLNQLTPPYVGICWRDAGQQYTATDVLTVDLLLAEFNGFNGTLVIVQDTPTAEEYKVLRSFKSCRIFDCSDLYQKQEELFILTSFLDEYVGPPSVILKMRQQLNLRSKLLLDENSDSFRDESNKIQTDAIVTTYRYGNKSSCKEAIRKIYVSIQKNKTESASPHVKLKSKKLDPDVDTISDVIEYSSKFICDTPDAELQKHLDALRLVFEVGKYRTKSALNIFVYHTDMGDAGKISYKDIQQNLGDYDYLLVLKTFVESVKRWRPDGRIYLVTDCDSKYFSLCEERVRVLGMEVDATQPMFERVCAMSAYVNSDAFDADTLFLDSDAFLNSTFKDILDSEFDIAITVRDDKKMMPANEGVLVARVERKENVVKFFNRYVATYQRLANEEEVKNYYGDIKKWRGGQLSLNAICHSANPFSSYRPISIDGVLLRVLPCDPYNYSWEYSVATYFNDLKTKKILHIKGGRKLAMEKISVAIRAFTPPTPKPPYISPNFAIFNKSYNDTPFSDEKFKSKFITDLANAAGMINTNQADSGAYIADDMFVWFRNMGFLSQPEFVSAFSPYFNDNLLRARIWRIYMLCWAARSCLNVDGEFADFGCYDGRTVHVVSRYVNLNDTDKKYFLYDLFENPTPESKKSKHGPTLFDEVKSLFKEYENVRVIKGAVPESFSQGGLPEKIAFAQVDLNEVEPELAVLEAIYDRVSIGGIIILDDYGFLRYKKSQIREYDFFSKRGDVVFECPTGQGLFIKRS